MAWKRRTLRHHVRFLLLQAREFRVSLALFALLVFGGGLLLHLTYPRDLGRPSYLGACYDILAMIFMETPLPFPDPWYLEILFFAVPVLGLVLIAESLVKFGFLLFTRKRHLPEWWIMVAQSLENHIVLCGLGRVGYRIARELLALGEPFVVIERKADSPLVAEIQDLGVPVLIGEVRLKATLVKANVPRAKALIAATDDDLANLDAALTAREIRPDLRVVMRLFDDTLANKVARSFQLPAISTSSAAAPAFVAAATGRAVYQPIEIGGRELRLLDLTVAPASPLQGMAVGELPSRLGVTAVLIHRGAEADLAPKPAYALAPGDSVLVLGEPARIAELDRANRPGHAAPGL